jgi:quercetin dioxygenase-like cupin family protein|tara:strand:+ start:2124 stop:2495 length:372 start_codon:yes stop_codon:yes gene_type:complete
MACKISQDKVVKLDLPGRISRQIVSGGSGANDISVRLVEIEVMTKGQSRKRHYHPDVEECIYVLEGVGRTETDTGKYNLRPGDTLIVPPNEWHCTLNTGDKTLKLLCFFPTGKVTVLGEESAV